MSRSSIEIAQPSWMEELTRACQRYPSDEDRMRLAVTLARENVLRDRGGPFGAAVFDAESGELLGAGVNCVLALRSSLLHAEVMAILFAQQRIGSYTLRAVPQGCDLFTSCAPCAMCLGAILWSGVRRVVYGASRDDASALGFDEGPVFAESFEYLRAREIAVESGLSRDEARDVLQLYQAAGGVIYNP